MSTTDIILFLIWIVMFFMCAHLKDISQLLKEFRLKSIIYSRTVTTVTKEAKESDQEKDRCET